jgi:hypothetical protein
MFTAVITLSVLVMAAFLYKLVAGLLARRRFVETAVATQATVLSVTGHMMGYLNSQRGLYGYSPRLRFTTEQGRIYEVEIDPDPLLDRYERGGTVTVQYDPTEPTSAVIADVESERSTRQLIGAIVVGMIAAGMAFAAVVVVMMSLVLGRLL